MTDRPDIWSHLKDHEALPPQDVCNRLQRILGVGEMERLQEHAVSPPLFLRQEIAQRSGIKPSTAGKLSPGRFRWYISAAACLVLIVAGWIFYGNNHTTDARTAAAEKKQVTPVAGVAVHADTLSESTDTTGGTGTLTTDAGAVAGSPRHLRPSYSIEGESISVTDNDLMATFTGFVYPDVPDYLTRNADQPLRIHIDQYTNITVSKNMLEMMKQMYQVLPNGKPARKARRIKRRLESWKERDQKRFDKSVNANPLDPVDLGEFIFK